MKVAGRTKKFVVFLRTAAIRYASNEISLLRKCASVCYTTLCSYIVAVVAASKRYYAHHTHLMWMTMDRYVPIVLLTHTQSHTNYTFRVEYEVE